APCRPRQARLCQNRTQRCATASTTCCSAARPAQTSASAASSLSPAIPAVASMQASRPPLSEVAEGTWDAEGASEDAGAELRDSGDPDSAAPSWGDLDLPASWPCGVAGEGGVEKLGCIPRDASRPATSQAGQRSYVPELRGSARCAGASGARGVVCSGRTNRVVELGKRVADAGVAGLGTGPGGREGPDPRGEPRGLEQCVAPCQ